MATIWNETFENSVWQGPVSSTWYDNDWSNVGETVTTGTLNADYSTAVSGWGSQCLRTAISVDSTSSANVYKELTANNPITYTRIEVYPLNISSFASGEDAGILTVYNKSWALAFFLRFYHNGTNLKFRFNAYYDSTNHFFDSDANVAINTKYCLEVYWNTTAGTWSWRVDGVEQDNGTSGTVRNQVGIVGLGQETGAYIVDTLMDNFNINDTAFLGPSAGVAAIEVQAIG